MADDLEAEARELRLRAARVAESEQAATAARQAAERINKAARIAAEAGGGPAAVARAAASLGVDRTAVAVMLDRVAASKAEQDRHQRNVMILRLAERGWTSKRIGERVGLSANYVSRIIQRALRHASGA